MKMSAKKKGLIGLVVMVVLGLAVLYGSDKLYQSLDKLAENKETEEENQAGNKLVDGTYKVEDEDFDESGYKGVVNMTVADGKVTELTWDNMDKDGKSKAQLSLDGEYVMTEEGLTWADQSKALADYVIEQQTVTTLSTDEEGKTDAVSGVSINVQGFMNLVEKAFEQASGGSEQTATALKDGTYKAEDADFDESGYKGVVNMTVAGGKVTELTWDNMDKDGKSKAQLSLDGEYVMTEDGLTWADQSKALADYVIEQQTVTTLSTDEEGKTDAVSGVSINVQGFINLVEKAFEQASGGSEQTATALKDGSYKAEDTDFDESGYKGVVNMTVAGGKVTELTWDNMDKDGKSKAQLSLDGEYVMTEDGLTWADQSKALADYVIEQQTVTTLSTDEEGKTDAVSGVSINVQGFINLVEKAFEQASGGSEQTATALKDGSYKAEDADFDESGYKGIVNLTVADGKVTELTWDNMDKDGKSKAQLSLDGEYVMTEDGLTWADQSKALADYVIEQQTVTTLSTDEEGKTDAVSGVSINVQGFINLVEKALEQAAENGTTTENSSSTETATLEDGTYKAEDPDFDDKGYKGVVNLTVADGKVTELTWDSMDKDGKGKAQLSLDGEYVMTEDGLTWADQSKALADYVIKNQTLDTLNVTDEGKTDAISGVSINIQGFINLVENALEQASSKGQNNNSSETGSFVLEEGIYSYEDMDFDSKGYKNTLKYTVSGGKITELTWDNVDKDGNLKSTLSLDGEYVMTEDGLPWADQAKAVCDYVIANQSLEGLNLSEDGKTDAISGVSISISDFYNCVERAFR